MDAAQHALRLQTTNVPATPPPYPPPQAGEGREGVSKRPHVTIRGLSKRFDKAAIYDNFDLDIPRGQLISVFGPNGCGKSTLINMIAGLIPVDAGEILFDGMQLSEIKFGYVFQNYREALFPWMRAFDNIAYPLKMMKVAPAERKARTERLVAHLGIKLDLNLYPYQMSGGQQQLVSIMRALVVEPEILFHDVMLLESLPQTFVGLRNGVSLALVIIVVAEMFIGSQDGLGHSVFEAQQLFEMPRKYAAIFAAGALGYGLNLLFLLVERRFVHWTGK
jgi:ABC-type branched-subunit amino acid transport system ATPase component